MSRRYRLSIFAIIGLTFLVASPPHGEAQTKQNDPKDSTGQIESPIPPVAVEEVKEGPEYYKPCRQQQDDRQSDLCAQWKAADAARESADWTKLSVWVSSAGAVIAFFTLCAAIAAAVFAKHASNHTREGATQARRSADSAEESLIASDRPWVKIDATITTDITFPRDGSGRQQGSIHVNFLISNFGKAPALQTLVYADVWPNNFGAVFSLQDHFAGLIQARKNGPKQGWTIFPDDKPKTVRHSLIITPDEIEKSRPFYRAMDNENAIAPDILCCVAYVNPRTGTHHETGMVFHIRRNGGQALSIAETCQVESINFETAIVGGYVT